LSAVLDSLRQRRQAAAAELRAIAEPAAEQNRYLSPDEQANYQRLHGEVDQLDQRIAELSATETRTEQTDRLLGQYAGSGPDGLSALNRELDQQFRSAILERNPAPIEIRPEGVRSWTQPGVERRDLLKTSATQALPTSVYGRILEHMVEQTAVLAAGATVVNTDSGETLQIPKSTSFVSSAITNEAAPITESDPTLAKVDLGAYKYGNFFQVSYELANDTTTDLMGFLARQAATSLALAYGPHLITGTGTGQPRGIVTDATVGESGAAAGGGFGTQGTAGQGTDHLVDLYSSLAEPYTRSPSVAWLMRTATLGTLRNFKTTAGELVGSAFAGPASTPGAQGTILGAPVFVDPGVAAIGGSAKSVLFGAMDRYFVRIAGGCASSARTTSLSRMT
jgi:HK97 family phage major capsid protein